MKFAYNSTWLKNLHTVKEAKRWQKHDWISKVEFEKISSLYQSSFYHPNLFIRILLFIATLIALSGVSGLLGLMFASAGETALPILCILYGMGSMVFLEIVFIKNNNHYKSGVNEAILYHSIGFILGGIAWITDGHIAAILICAILIFGFSSIRFIDLISTVCGLCSLAYLIFYLLYQAGGIIQSLIPFALIIFFSGFYFLILKWKNKKENESWEDGLIIVEAFSLLVIYAAGNYLVVRELSISMMNLQLEEGQDIPFAWLFYFLTVAIPILYLYFGIKKKDLVMIRVSLVAIAFAVFTFKYYFSLGHHEITLTVGGVILIGISLWLFRYLKTPRNGFTAENILSERWGNANLSAFLISQTMGGNKTPERSDEMGGTFGGGGSTDSF
jgi:hypothetical protein